MADMTIRRNYVGDRYGRVVVLRDDAPPGTKVRRVLCKCDCGNEKEIILGKLRNGEAKSCGCLNREMTTARNTTVGVRQRGVRAPRWYHAWDHIIQRCTNPKDKEWHCYGGRGIAVCDRWRDPSNFLQDMGEPPPGTSIDRIDNNGNYEPANCRWATRVQQMRNKRSNRIVHWRGRDMCLAEAVQLAELKYDTVHMRLKHGWSVERALETPVSQVRV